jgi:hypothetical protein
LPRQKKKKEGETNKQGTKMEIKLSYRKIINFLSLLFSDGFPNFQSSFPEWCEDERSNNMQSNTTEQLMGLR